jgi:hypothetical protein
VSHCNPRFDRITLNRTLASKKSSKSIRGMSILSGSNVVMVAEEMPPREFQANGALRTPLIHYREGGKAMEYLLLIYENEKRFSQGYPEDELAEYRAFGQEYATAIKGGNALQPTQSATTVRVRDGKSLTTDGPFAETKEQLGGYYLVEAPDAKSAAAMAAKIPAARFGSVEVRPILKFS